MFTRELYADEAALRGRDGCLEGKLVMATGNNCCLDRRIDAGAQAARKVCCNV